MKSNFYFYQTFKIYLLKLFRLSGLFEFRRPVVLLRDPEIIKQLTIKDFDYFMDHRSVITEENDPMFGKTLVALRGQKWRDMRSTLSPAFTGLKNILMPRDGNLHFQNSIGSKMRQMMDFVSEIGLQTTESLRKDIESGENKFEFKALASKFTGDIIASTGNFFSWN
jgi:cytochrome P450 family 9